MYGILFNRCCVLSLLRLKILSFCHTRENLVSPVTISQHEPISYTLGVPFSNTALISLVVVLYYSRDHRNAIMYCFLCHVITLPYNNFLRDARLSQLLFSDLKSVLLLIYFPLISQQKTLNDSEFKNF